MVIKPLLPDSEAPPRLRVVTRSVQDVRSRAPSRRRHPLPSSVLEAVVWTGNGLQFLPRVPNGPLGTPNLRLPRREQPDGRRSGWSPPEAGRSWNVCVCWPACRSCSQAEIPGPPDSRVPQTPGLRLAPPGVRVCQSVRPGLRPRLGQSPRSLRLTELGWPLTCVAPAAHGSCLGASGPWTRLTPVRAVARPQAAGLRMWTGPALRPAGTDRLVPFAPLRAGVTNGVPPGPAERTPWLTASEAFSFGKEEGGT